MLEPVLPEDSAADDHGRENAPPNGRDRKDNEGTDVVTERTDRQRADRTGDDAVDRESTEPFDGPTIDGRRGAHPNCAQLYENAADDRERKERKLVEEVRPHDVERPAKYLEEGDAHRDRDAQEDGRGGRLSHPVPLVHRLVAGFWQ